MIMTTVGHLRRKLADILATSNNVKIKIPHCLKNLHTI